MWNDERRTSVGSGISDKFLRHCAFAGVILSTAFAAPAVHAVQTTVESPSIRITPRNLSEELEAFLANERYDAARDLELSLRIANQAVETGDLNAAARSLLQGLRRMEREGATPLELAYINTAIADVERLRGDLAEDVAHRRAALYLVQSVHGKGAMTTETLRRDVSASFSLKNIQSASRIGIPGPRAFDDFFMSRRFAIESRKNLQERHGPDHPATRYAQAFEALMRITRLGRRSALETFDELLGGPPGAAIYRTAADLEIEKLRLGLLNAMGKESARDKVERQLNEIVFDEPVAILLQDFDHAALLGRPNTNVAAAGVAAFGVGPSSDLLTPPPARFRGSQADVAYCIRSDGRIDDIEVVRTAGHSEWPERLTSALSERRYVRWRTENSDETCMKRFERFTVATGQTVQTGSRLSRPSGFSELVITDLLSADGSLGVDYRSDGESRACDVIRQGWRPPPSGRPSTMAMRRTKDDA